MLLPFSVFTERQKRPAPKGEETEKKDEEEWQLKDVVFVEDVKSVPVGKAPEWNILSFLWVK